MTPVTLPKPPFEVPPAPTEMTRAGKSRPPRTTIAQRIAAIRAARDEWRRAQEC